MEDLKTTVVPGNSLPTQPWWAEAHSAIIAAYEQKDVLARAFPADWPRVNPDPTLGAKGLAQELGPKGELVVMFKDDRVAACGGIEPFRGADWFNDLNLAPSAELANGEITSHEAGTVQEELASDPLVEEWEVCSFCVHPDYRGHGLARKLVEKLVERAKAKGGRKLVANYSIEEMGSFWPKMGLTETIGKGSVLKKGFTYMPGLEGLKEDLHFKMSAIVFES